MGLLDEIEQAQAVPVKVCKTGRVLQNLPKADAEDLRTAIANPQIQTEAIVRVLNNHGYSLSTSQFGAHRRGECCCVISG